MASRTDITPDVCRKLLEYHPDTGILTWKEMGPEMFEDYGVGGSSGNAARWNAQFAGKPALDHSGYGRRRTGTMLGVRFAAHRVIWAMVHNYWPDCIDHIDGNPGNNKINNLRDVSHAENMKNRSLQTNNTSGVTGVSWNKIGQKWEAYIKINGTRRSLGRFKRFDDAVTSRLKAEKKEGFTDLHGKKLSAYST